MRSIRLCARHFAVGFFIVVVAAAALCETSGAAPPSSAAGGGGTPAPAATVAAQATDHPGGGGSPSPTPLPGPAVVHVHINVVRVRDARLVQTKTSTPTEYQFGDLAPFFSGGIASAASAASSAATGTATKAPGTVAAPSGATRQTPAQVQALISQVSNEMVHAERRLDEANNSYVSLVAEAERADLTSPDGSAAAVLLNDIDATAQVLDNAIAQSAHLDTTAGVNSFLCQAPTAPSESIFQAALPPENPRALSGMERGLDCIENYIGDLSPADAAMLQPQVTRLYVKLGLVLDAAATAAPVPSSKPLGSTAPQRPAATAAPKPHGSAFTTPSPVTVAAVNKLNAYLANLVSARTVTGPRTVAPSTAPRTQSPTPARARATAAPTVAPGGTKSIACTDTAGNPITANTISSPLAPVGPDHPTDCLNLLQKYQRVKAWSIYLRALRANVEDDPVTKTAFAPTAAAARLRGSMERDVAVKCGPAVSSTVVAYRGNDMLADPLGNAQYVSTQQTVACGPPQTFSLALGYTGMPNRVPAIINAKSPTSTGASPASVKEFGYSPNDSQSVTYGWYGFNTRLSEINDNSSYYFTMLVRANVKQFEGFFGPSYVLNKSFFITPGIHVAPYNFLGGGWSQGNVVPSSVTSAPVDSHYVGRLGIMLGLPVLNFGTGSAAKSSQSKPQPSSSAAPKSTSQ